MGSQQLYAIRNPVTGLIKIGLASDPRQRMYELETGAGTALELLLVSDTAHARAAESYVHKALTEYRVFREWFELPDPSVLPDLFSEASQKLDKKEVKKARCEASEKLLKDTIACVRVEMARRGMTGADLAREMGMSRQHVSQLLNGKVAILPPSMFNVLNALDLKVSPYRDEVSS